MIKSIYKNFTFAISLLLIFSLTAPVFAQRKRNASTPSKKQTAEVSEEKGAEFCEIWSGTIQFTGIARKTHTKVTNKGEHISDQYYTGKAGN
jgi:hypothetical protein